MSARKAIAVLLLGVTASACARTPEVDAKAEERAIRALDEQWGAAVARKDVGAAVALYAADGALLWPDAPETKGIDGIRAVWTSVMSTPGLSVAVHPERIDVARAGDLATDAGTVQSDVETSNGHVQTIDKYLHVWRKDGGRWRVIYSMTNSNTPPAPPTSSHMR